SGAGPASLRDGSLQGGPCKMRCRLMPTTNKRYKAVRMDDNKQKALAAALSQIEKQYGKGSIMKMDAEAAKDVPVVSTGALRLDPAPGVRSLPRRRMDD